MTRAYIGIYLPDEYIFSISWNLEDSIPFLPDHTPVVTKINP